MSEPLKYHHLVGKEYREGANDCWHTLCQFYNDNFGIDFPDFACPDNWAANGLNLFQELLPTIGFEVVTGHPNTWKPADLVVMQLQSAVWNHAGVFVDTSGRPLILHHLTTRRVIVEPYRGLWRNTTVAVMRHKDVQYEPPLVLSDITNHIRRRGTRAS